MNKCQFCGGQPAYYRVVYGGNIGDLVLSIESFLCKDHFQAIVGREPKPEEEITPDFFEADEQSSNEDWL